MIQTSEQIDALAAALAKAQGEIDNVSKDRENPHFKSRYATLANVLDEARPKFAKNGISILQMPVNGEGSNIGVATRLLHSSGQWIESTLFVAPTKFDAQGAGSAITYLRRFALMAMAGIAPEDDDGNAASVAAPQPRPQAAPRPAAVSQAHPAEPPEVTAARAAERAAFWSRDDYGINPEVISGGIGVWDREMLAMAETAPNLDAFLKLKDENKPFFMKWAGHVAQPVIKGFNARMDTAYRRVRQMEGVAA